MSFSTAIAPEITPPPPQEEPQKIITIRFEPQANSHEQKTTEIAVAELEKISPTHANCFTDAAKDFEGRTVSSNFSLNLPFSKDAFEKFRSFHSGEPPQTPSSAIDTLTVARHLGNEEVIEKIDNFLKLIEWELPQDQNIFLELYASAVDLPNFEKKADRIISAWIFHNILDFDTPFVPLIFHKILNFMFPDENFELLRKFQAAGFTKYALPFRVKNPRLSELTTYCSFVTSLDLVCGQAITDERLKSLQPLIALQSLDISCCRNITDAGLAHLQPFTALYTLQLLGCHQITNRGLAHIQHLAQLRTLNISSCEGFTNEGLSHLKPLTALQSLNLSHCKQITDAGLVHLQPLTKLQLLIIVGYNRVTKVGIQSLKNHLPHLEIHESSQVSSQK